MNSGYIHKSIIFFSLSFFFFFKQKTAYEMLRSLVGSEMCIRDREIGSTNSDGRPDNWPVCRPFTRVAIEEDIVVGPHVHERQWFAKLNYWAWYGNVVLLWWNFICMCAYTNVKDSNIGIVFLALCYAILGSVCAFYGWFKLGYKSVEGNSNFLLFMYLGIFGLSTLWWVAVAVGVPEAGMAGFIAMLKLFGSNDGVAIMALVNFIFACTMVVGMGYIWLKGKAIYSGLGGTEKTQEIANNAKTLAQATNSV
eukprot:TRINITY_DN8260_c0_g1_i1.p1 TRINITY_DN8260_c0_g1~~TRINITY_DN8260_c0_g1_i1.p1  ORF type:complete len:252 (-),score=72.97 TRINITY_DN8260_c0_g1_i1:445-1200(-)